MRENIHSGTARPIVALATAAALALGALIASPAAAAEPETFTTSVPVITGDVSLGGILTANTGTWTPGPTFSYQWFRNNFPIEGATGAAYSVTAADQGTAILVIVTGTKPDVPTASATSDPVMIPAAVVTPPPPTALKTISAITPKIKGTVRVGKTLKVTPKWKPSPTLSYQWYANGKMIKKADSAKLKLTKSLKGKKISVNVTGTKSGYKTVIKTTRATAKVKKK